MTSRSRAVWYFAYGSNLCRGKMLKTIGGPWQEEQTGVAKGFEVVFNKNSTKWGAAANIVVARRKKSRGVLYKISPVQFRRLKQSEKDYKPICLELETESGRKIIGQTFVALMDRITRARLPKQQYLDFIWTGGIEHGLPRRYLRGLMDKGRGRQRS